MGTSSFTRYVIGTAILCLASMAAAEIELRLTLSEKVAASDNIVHARCVQTRTEWRNGIVVTQADFVVLDDLRGKGAQNLHLTVPGGTAVHPTLGIPVTTALSNGVEVRVDDEAILFSKADAQGENRLVAGEQAYVRLGNDASGKAYVRTDERRVVAKPSGDSGTSSVATDATDVSTETYSIDDFKQSIRLAVSQQAPAREDR